MEISTYNSNKIAAINMLLIFFVLILHSFYVEAKEFTIANAVQEFAGTNGLTGVAVPMFFLISGMLFFKGVASVKDSLPRIRKRVRSLLVPYVIWNIIFVLWYLIIQSLPGVTNFINNDVVGKVCSPDILSNLYYVLWKPINFPLWFLRDLMIMVVVSPILFYLVKYLKWGAPLLVLFVSPYVNLYVSPFFLLGGCIAMHSNLKEINTKLAGGGKMILPAIIYVGNAVAQLFTDYSHPYIKFIVYLCGAILIWRLYDWIYYSSVQKPRFLKRMMRFSFFTYLFHEPVLNIIKKVGLKVYGCNDASLIILYLTCPIIMYCVAVLVAVLLKQYVPKVYAVLTGGR